LGVVLGSRNGSGVAFGFAAGRAAGLVLAVGFGVALALVIGLGVAFGLAAGFGVAFGDLTVGPRVTSVASGRETLSGAGSTDAGGVSPTRAAAARPGWPSSSVLSELPK
jgi:hypothetical protein